MILLRFGITAVTMVPIIIWLKHSFKIDLKSFALAVCVAITLLLYNKYYYLGTKLGTASLLGRCDGYDAYSDFDIFVFGDFRNKAGETKRCFRTHHWSNRGFDHASYLEF